MNIQILIFSYMIICVSMIFFNSYVIVLRRTHPEKMRGFRKKLKNRIEFQLEQIKRGKPVEDEHKNFLIKKLVNFRTFIAFDTIVSSYIEAEYINNYFHQIKDVFSIVAIEFQKQKEFKKAFFANSILKYNIVNNFGVDIIAKVMLTFVYEKSLYCRENALSVLYQFGNANYIVQALKVIEKMKYFHHSKLLTEGMLSFRGNHKELISLLWKNFNNFNFEIQVAILNYIRLKDGDYCKEFFELLENEKTPTEIKYQSIRYLGKYQYKIAKEKLIFLLNNSENEDWEFAALSATALSIYPSTEVVIALKAALYSSNWYLRHNAAESLLKLKVSMFEILDILKGDDVFAREIVNYKMKYEESQYQTEVIRYEG